MLDQSSPLIPHNGNNAFSFPVDGTHFSVAGIRLPVLTAGTHTVTVTVTSSTSGSNTVNIIGLCHATLAKPTSAKRSNSLCRWPAL